MDIFLLCLKIFFVRIIDVSLGTMKTILTVKGKKIIAACIAFVEVLIWFLVVREALNTNLKSFFIPISYALGYASGTLVGMFLSDKYIDGIIGVDVITTINTKDLIENLRKNNYAVSIIPLKREKLREKKEMLFIQINKNKIKHLTKLIKLYDKKAFIVVNETKYVRNGFIKK